MSRTPASFYWVASLFLLQGLFGAYRGLDEWLHGKIYLPLDVVCIFISWGLFNHRNSWRKFAVGCLWFELILSSVLFTWFIFSGKHATANGSYPSWLPHPDVLVSMALAFGCVLCLWSIHVLTSHRVLALFSEPDNGKPASTPSAS